MLVFFCSFCNVFSFHIFAEKGKVQELTQVHFFSVLHIFYTFSVHQIASSMGFYFLGGRNGHPWTFQWLKIPNCWRCLCLPAQYLLQCKRHCFTVSQNWILKRQKANCRGKWVVQSRGWANMNFLLVWSCNSRQLNCQYLTRLLHHRYVKLHVVQEVSSCKTKRPNTSPHVYWTQQLEVFDPSDV